MLIRARLIKKVFSFRFWSVLKYRKHSLFLSCEVPAKEETWSFMSRKFLSQYEAVATTVVSMCQLPVGAELPSVPRGFRSSARFFWGLRYCQDWRDLKFSLISGFQLANSCEPAFWEERILEFSSSWCQCPARPCGVALLCRSQVERVPWVCALRKCVFHSGRSS